MKQIILCLGCSKQVGCKISGVAKLCETCKRVPTCHLNDVTVPTTESFVTCAPCAEKQARDDYD